MYGEKIRADDAELFGEVVEAILSVMGDDAVKIILYGSVARGDNTPESDVDIAVLSRRPYDWREREKLLDVTSPLGLKHGTLFSVKVIDEDKFNKWLFDLPFYFNIDEEGKTLWMKETA